VSLTFWRGIYTDEKDESCQAEIVAIQQGRDGSTGCPTCAGLVSFISGFLSALGSIQPQYIARLLSFITFWIPIAVYVKCPPRAQDFVEVRSKIPIRLCGEAQRRDVP